jgi:sarcosine oxidase subunit alpha
MSQPNRLPADAPHHFGGIALDRTKPLAFRLDGRRIEGFFGDTVLSAVLANGIDIFGTLGKFPLGLTPQFCPAVSENGGAPLPMERLPAIDGLALESVGRRTFRRRNAQSLHHILDGRGDPGWSQIVPAETLAVDVLIVGGGVAGLSAAEAAVETGRTVALVERRPWLGGDARYFGTVGDEESPESLTTRLAAQLADLPGVTLFAATEVFALHGTTALLHRVDTPDSHGRAQVIAVTAKAVVLAQGTQQRLPVFPGNRLPRILRSIDAYHLAKRFGVSLAPSAIVSTQSNHAYRLAIRLSDAGIKVRRVVDSRIHPQSRFIDFSKATGLTLASGQHPLDAQPGLFSFANEGAVTPAATLEAGQLIVSGSWQPDLTLWMKAGGRSRWSVTRGGLVAVGEIDNIVLAGAAAGYRSLAACRASGRMAARHVVGDQDLPVPPIADTEFGTEYETADASTSIAPAAEKIPSFFSSGNSLASRPVTMRVPALSLGDVAASVELGLVAPGDAGAIAEERGAPGDDLVPSGWRPSDISKPAAYLAHRFGPAPGRVHLIVDDTRRFDVGALVYRGGDPREPANAVGVIVEAATPGGVALIAADILAATDRFVIQTATGPSPARLRR